MQKEKIFELKIEEDDDVSGIDRISLVDVPAIEVNWVAFKKEGITPNPCWEGYEPIGLKPDGSPNCVPIKKEKMESISDYPDSIKNNAKAVLKWVDENGWGSCGTDVGKQRASQLANGEPLSVDTIKRMYSYLSRHAGDLDASKGYGDGCGKLMYDSWGGKSALSWAESKLKGLGFSLQEEFAGNIVSLDYDGTLSTERGKTLARTLKSEGYKVYIVTARQSTQLGEVYKVADQLGIPHDCVYATNGQLKWKKLKELGVSKHYDNNPEEIKAIRTNLPEVKAEQFEYDVASIGGYKDPGVTGKTDFSSLFYFNKEKNEYNFQIDNEKHMVLGPAMIPDQKIFRKDAKGNPYYVFFTAETIKMIAEKYMRNKYIDNNDSMHNGQTLKDVYVVESWIKEDSGDKSSKYGFSELPIGTWFVSMKINNPNVWSQIKEGQLNGFSVSGYFEEVAQFAKEEKFLKELAKLLKDI